MPETGSSESEGAPEAPNALPLTEPASRSVSVRTRPAGPTLAIVALGVFALVARGSRLLAHPDPLDVVAIVAALALIGLGIYNALRGRLRRAVALYVAEAVLALIVIVRIDAPWARTDGTVLVDRGVARVLAWKLDTYPASSLDHTHAAWMRLIAAGQPDLQDYTLEAPQAIVAAGRCGDLVSRYTIYVRREALLRPYFEPALAACAAAMPQKGST